MKSDHSRLLRLALGGNAIFSGLSGLLLVAVPRRVADWLGIEALGLLLAIGIGLLLFALFLIFLVRARPLDAQAATSVIFGDLAWVLASGALLVFWPGLLSDTGWWVVLAVAVAVLVFADLQWLGLRRLLRPA
jgi:hypothetical protein